MSTLRLENVKVTLAGRQVLDIRDLKVDDGGFYAVIGRNGSGKSTLLRVMGGLLRPDTGRVLMDEVDLHSGGIDPADRSRKVGFLFQHPYLFKGTVASNTEYGLKLRGVKRAERRAAAKSMLETVGLGEHVSRDSTALSGGESRRAALARTLALQPGILLLDEPFSGIDSVSSLVMENLLADLNRRGVTVVFSTHDADQALRLAKNILNLHGGRLIEGSVRNVFHGRIERGSSGDIFRAGGLEFAIPTGHPDAATIAIPPEAVLVVESKIIASARNAFHGRITRIEERNGSVEVTADVGEPLSALITTESYRKLALHVGQETTLVFKAESARLY
jgi:molybdopterin-binding protein